MVNYVPKERDIVYIDFSPIKGHEQNGVRPALVLSSKLFNGFTHMAMVCPISKNNKYFPTHYELTDTKEIQGSVLCEHIRSIDYEKRNIKYVDKCSEEDFKNIVDLVSSFFEKE